MNLREAITESKKIQRSLTTSNRDKKIYHWFQFTKVSKL